MAVTPNSINFNHLKNAALPPARVVNYNVSDNGDNFVSASSNTNWVSATNLTFTSGQVNLNNNVNSLPVGTHTATITFYNNSGGGFHEPDTPSNSSNFVQTTIGSVTITAVITESVVLNLSPEQLTYNYEFGGANPQNQTVSVTSENSWTVSENTNWLGITTTSGSNNGSFEVSVTPSGLTAGTHTANITVDDGVTTKILTVTLIISEPDTGTNYLYATPVVLNFGYTISGILPPVKRIEMNSSGNWTATTNKTWLNLIPASGVSGVGYLDVGLQNLSSLTVGNHFATVSITNGNLVKSINITLSVYQFIQELLSDSELYFTDDNNLIKVSSGRTDTHLQIKATAQYEGQAYEIPYNIPFYNGTAEKRIGLEAKKIISERPFIGVGSASLFNAYPPLELNLEINEVELNSSTLTQSVNLQNIKFIKGTTPSNLLMSDISQTIYTTKTGIVMFSFLGKKYVPVNTIKITGATTKTYTFSNSIEPYYTAVIPVSDLNVAVGDEIFITSGDVSIKVIIKPADREQSFIFWENQFGFWDAIEFTGEFVASASLKATAFEYRKDYKTTVQKVLAIKDKGTYKINTGNLYTDAELTTIRKMLNATNLYLYQNNQLTAVKSTTKKLEIYKTDNNLKATNLTFENIEI